MCREKVIILFNKMIPNKSGELKFGQLIHFNLQYAQFSIS